MVWYGMVWYGMVNHNYNVYIYISRSDNLPLELWRKSGMDPWRKSIPLVRAL